MDIQEILANQYIVKRSKASQAKSNTNIINLFQDIRPVKRKNRTFLSILPAKKTLYPKPSRLFSAVKKQKPYTQTSSKILDMIQFFSSAKAIKPIAIILGLAILVPITAALVGLEKKASLKNFMFSEDTSLYPILLNAISPQLEYPDSEALADLPTRLVISKYKVSKNETLDSIARRFSLTLDTVISINAIKNVRYLQAGTTIKIPNINGVLYVVQKGDSLASISKAKNVSLIDIVDANDLLSETLTPGQSLFIPGAKLSATELKRALGSLVIWPFKGNITDYFGYRPNPFTGVRHFHSGIDIAGPLNSKVKAAMDGKVAETGYSTIFGNFVILSHPDGYQTLYAHLNKILVTQGSSISQGSTLGLVGSTGYSTGPHLHFGVFKNSQAINPLKILK